MITDLYNTGNVESVSAAGAEVMQFSEELPLRDVKLLWVVTLDPAVGESHGAGMRFLNFARELALAGGRVYFAANVFPGENRTALEQFLSKLESDGIIAGWMITTYGYTARQGRMGALVLYPGLTNRVLKDVQTGPVDDLCRFVKAHGITSVVVSDRRLFFIGDALRNVLPTVLDWTDSLNLHYWRALCARFRSRHLSGLFGFLRDYQSNLLSEFYYGRRAHLNTAVSPVDKAWLDWTNFKPAHNRLWMNGTKTDECPPVEKIRKRLIFSGAMDYAPNYEGALWFIDHVLPLILTKHPEAQFVVAGVNPVPELVARAGTQVHITGFVQDLGTEIARSSLYVAPLLSGGGFRNKVVEAIMKGTYLIGTPMSVEFLPPEFRRLLAVARNAREMADLVVSHLDSPQASDQRLTELRRIVMADFSWQGRSRDLVRFLSEAGQVFLSRQAGK
jgi:glycosyltransferase involved in cell wall biosynthesis